ncbi:hypothetical protein IF655_04295 [Streptomyces sp. DSM 110735]|nr:hypothetical protein [Streptomyces sp. DSM 110735]MBJ7902511.1 hypothetical protein [Streptomyces sp. DSM 110735]
MGRPYPPGLTSGPTTALTCHVSAVVLWRGDPREADGRHLVEWTVDDAIR